ncbi:MAG: hypothetical protein PUD22_07785 [Erysipelotrichaceae bacterium]|nr:hypothetical protein [Erysipelotrichaceae bacterium]
MARLTRTQKYAERREALANGTVSVKSEQLSAYDERFKAIEKTLTPIVENEEVPVAEANPASSNSNETETIKVLDLNDEFSDIFKMLDVNRIEPETAPADELAVEPVVIEHVEEPAENAETIQKETVAEEKIPSLEDFMMIFGDVQEEEKKEEPAEEVVPVMPKTEEESAVNDVLSDIIAELSTDKLNAEAMEEPAVEEKEEASSACEEAADEEPITPIVEDILHEAREMATALDNEGNQKEEEAVADEETADDFNSVVESIITEVEEANKEAGLATFTELTSEIVDEVRHPEAFENQEETAAIETAEEAADENEADSALEAEDVAIEEERPFEETVVEEPLSEAVETEEVQEAEEIAVAANEEPSSDESAEETPVQENEEPVEESVEEPTETAEETEVLEPLIEETVEASEEAVEETNETVASEPAVEEGVAEEAALIEPEIFEEPEMAAESDEAPLEEEPAETMDNTQESSETAVEEINEAPLNEEPAVEEEIAEEVEAIEDAEPVALEKTEENRNEDAVVVPSFVNDYFDNQDEDEDDEEFSNTVSLEISKLMEEIDNGNHVNESGMDMIHAVGSASEEVKMPDFLADYFKPVKEEKNEHPAMAIAAEEADLQEDVVEIKNLSEIEKEEKIAKTIEDTIPFVVTKNVAVEEEKVIDDETPNKVLNVILGILIVVLLAVLGLIVYYILAAKGII